MAIEKPIEIGNRIKELRSLKGLSQEELANNCGLDRTYINAVEKGKRNITLVSLKRITESLNITFKNFFDENYIYPTADANKVFLISCDTDNYNKTMINGVKVSDIDKYFSENDAENIKKFADNGLIYIWGTSSGNTSKFRELNINDVCVFSKQKKIIGTSTLLYKCESTKFSKKFWKNKKNPDFIWPNIFIMSKPIELNIDAYKLLEAGKYKKTFVQGFTIPRGKHNVLIKQYLEEKLKIN
ncbi:helix-turn-helix protein [Anaeroplasma bactoclasticum]|jgi:transcriptional regulator with XRE-family HTH domain|uniref:Helix-turn-helix protein n=1 Tax=Anaeroplasma bactoclasticum TaxID=2088 RepID=A0A397RZE2_9MOLU|nr:helix-turn-helix transcriptional regulator [Anaeroplasma bactoclasticum]RIA77926.1 helix-turn-helix protein [Anaeroplasma bactoclasticum]